MRRDSLFGEPVLWSGRPKEVSTPPLFRAGAAVCTIGAVIATMSAVVVARMPHVSVGGLLFFAAWMATLAIGFGFLPRWWLGELEFIVTDRHIVLKRGRLRRHIDRREISFARIHWHPTIPGVGDLELVRAVPTGALQRRLSIVLHGLAAPDRVWAIMRGVTPATPAGDGHRLLAQRLDEGERVVWSAQPGGGWRHWVPTDVRGAGSVVIAILLAVVTAIVAFHAVHALRSVVAGGMSPRSMSFVALVTSLFLAVFLLTAGSVGILYTVVVKPALLSGQTRYLITDRRVLIQRGDEELHLDRARIVDVIDSATSSGLHDLFLVLDGPKARAVAASGAFGERHGIGLQPVLLAVSDAEIVQEILGTSAPGRPAGPRPGDAAVETQPL